MDTIKSPSQIPASRAGYTVSSPDFTPDSPTTKTPSVERLIPAAVPSGTNCDASHNAAFAAAPEAIIKAHQTAQITWIPNFPYFFTFTPRKVSAHALCPYSRQKNAYFELKYGIAWNPAFDNCAVSWFFYDSASSITSTTLVKKHMTLLPSIVTHEVA